MNSDQLREHAALLQGPLPWCAFRWSDLPAENQPDQLEVLATNQAFDRMCRQLGVTESAPTTVSAILDAAAVRQLLAQCQGDEPGSTIPVTIGTQHYQLSAYTLDNNQAACHWIAVSSNSAQHSNNFVRREAEFMNLLVNLNIAIVVHQPDTSISFSNTAASEMLGLTIEQMQGKAAIDPAWCFMNEQGDPMPIEDYPVMRVLSSRQPLKAYVVGINRPQQGRCWVYVSAYPEFDDLGELYQVVITFTDITERRRSEEERRRLNEHLVQAQRVESLGRLAGGIAHDFNNMLAVIQGQTELALSYDNLDHRLTRHLNQIHQATERSARLTSQLLAYARKQAATPELLDLNDAIEGILELLRRIIGDSVTLRWDPCEEQPLINIDPVQLDQILTNLCVNARDAMSGESAGVITISTSVIDDRVCMRVADNGCGIPESVLAHIFEPFFTTKSVDQGTGLGLATVDGIVQQNGGKIEATSTIGSGTRFDIYLPLARGVQPAREEQNSPRSSQNTQRTVLIIEDEVPLLDMLRTYLESREYRVYDASTLDQAVAVMAHHGDSIDLLICDVVMPDINGKELCERLRRYRPEVPCLFMSGYPQDIISKHGLVEAGYHFISKPFALTDLEEAITTTLKRSRTRCKSA